MHIRKGSHSVFSVKLHFVFVTRYRRTNRGAQAIHQQPGKSTIIVTKLIRPCAMPEFHLSIYLGRNRLVTRYPSPPRLAEGGDFR